MEEYTGYVKVKQGDTYITSPNFHSESKRKLTMRLKVWLFDNSSAKDHLLGANSIKVSMSFKKEYVEYSRIYLLTFIVLSFQYKKSQKSF